MLPFDKISASYSDIAHSSVPLSIANPILYQSRYYSVLPALEPLVAGHIDIVPNKAVYQIPYLAQTDIIKADVDSLIQQLVAHMASTLNKSVLLFEESIKDGLKRDHRLVLLPVDDDIYGMVRFLYNDWAPINKYEAALQGYQMIRYFPKEDVGQASCHYIRSYSGLKPSCLLSRLAGYMDNQETAPLINRRKKIAALF